MIITHAANAIVNLADLEAKAVELSKLRFVPFINHAELTQAINEVAQQIEAERQKHTVAELARHTVAQALRYIHEGGSPFITQLAKSYACSWQDDEIASVVTREYTQFCEKAGVLVDLTDWLISEISKTEDWLVSEWDTTVSDPDYTEFETERYWGYLRYPK